MKGQVFSIDSLVALSIFMMIIAMIAYVWIEVSVIPSFDIQGKANEIADFMVSIKMGEQNVLNCSKLFALTVQDYEDLRTELNTGPYDFWIEIEGIEPEACPDVRPELDVMLVLDVSGSMDGEKILDLKEAATAFVDELNESYDQAGLISYSTNANVDFGLLNMTDSNKTTLKGNNCIEGVCASCGEGINQLCCRDSWTFGCSGDEITHCDDCSGGTNIGDGILEAITEQNKGRSFPPVFKIQVLLSDGNPTYPYGSGSVTDPGDIEHTLNASYQACLNDNIIYTISLGGDANRTLMQEIAKKTYGKEYYAPTSDDLHDIFLNISREIAVTSNYGKIAPNNAKDISTVTRVVRIGNKTLKMNVRIYEFIPGVTKVCE